MSEYAHPEVLVSTEWVAQHLNDPNVRILEVDYEPQDAYELGHIPNSALVIKVSGAASTTIRWVATVRTVEVIN